MATMELELEIGRSVFGKLHRSIRCCEANTMQHDHEQIRQLVATWLTAIKTNDVDTMLRHVNDKWLIARDTNLLSPVNQYVSIG
jgi:hypothetical protein